MTFRNYLEESNINKKNWENLKKFMKKQPGFKSWEFEGYLEELVIKFKSNKQAILALQNSNASALEVSAFGDASSGDSEIRVELNKDAMNAMNEAQIFQLKGKIGKKTVSLPISAKNKKDAEEKFIKRIDLEQKNGNAPKGELTDILCEEDLEEAIKAKKVYDYLLSSMTKIQNIGTYYAQDKGKVDKMNRRILTDYASNDNKLTEIYKQITKITKNLENDFKELESIIG